MGMGMGMGGRGMRTFEDGVEYTSIRAYGVLLDVLGERGALCIQCRLRDAHRKSARGCIIRNFDRSPQDQHHGQTRNIT